jgi:hypothetical protein
VKKNVSRPISKIEYSNANGRHAHDIEIVWRYGTPDTTRRTYFWDENGWLGAKVERKGGSISLSRYAYDQKGGKVIDFFQYELKDEADLKKALTEGPEQLAMRPESRFSRFHFEYDPNARPLSMVRYGQGGSIEDYQEKVSFYPDGRVQAYYFRDRTGDGISQTTEYKYDSRGLLLEIWGHDHQGKPEVIRHEWE